MRRSTIRWDLVGDQVRLDQRTAQGFREDLEVRRQVMRDARLFSASLKRTIGVMGPDGRVLQ